MNRHTRIETGALLVVTSHALLVAQCAAQSFDQTPVTIEFKQDGTVEARLPFDIDAMLADRPFRELSDADYKRIRAMPSDERAKRMEEITNYLKIRLRLKFDGKAIDTKIMFPELKRESKKDETALPGNYFIARGEVPSHAKVFTFTASPVFFEIFLLIRVEGRKTGKRYVLQPGAETEAFRDFPKEHADGPSKNPIPGDQRE